MSWLEPFVGQQVVVDLDADYLVLGTLAEVTATTLVFTDADLHDHREANSTKEVYALESRKIGIRVNRVRVTVPLHRLVAISRLEEL